MEFSKKFSTRENCLLYLSEQKWASGYRCKKCQSTEYIPGNTCGARRCKYCKYDESATAGTLFHGVKFPLVKAFHIVYRLSTKKGMSSYELSKEVGVTQKTAWLFGAKVRESMASSGKHPLTGEVHVDEYVIGGKEAGKPGRSLGKKKPVLIMMEKRGKNQTGRVYAQSIANYRASTIYPILSRQIAPEADIVTDEYPSYDNLKSIFNNARQIKSEKGKKFPALHQQIMNMKGALRGIHHKCSEKHLQSYLDQYCYRTNRRSMKKPIVFNLINKMLTNHPITYQYLKLKAA
jgi:transposase-like protein